MRMYLGDKIKIFRFLTNTCWGGVEENTLALVRRMPGEIFFNIIACPYTVADTFKERLEGVNCSVIPIDADGMTNPREIFRLYRIIRHERPEIVHSHLFRSSAIASPLAALVGVPVVIETAHLGGEWRGNVLKRWRLVDQTVAYFVTKIIAVSEALKRYLVEAKTISPEKVEVIHNGRDLDYFRPLDADAVDALKSKLQITKEQEVITVVGRLQHQKGHKYFLEALPGVIQEFPNLRVLLVGDGELRGQLEEYCRSLGVEKNVIFTGFQEDVRGMLGISDVVVLPSLFEGLPLTTIETSAMGKAIVATAVNGTPEVVKHGETGLLVPPKEPLALKDAVLTLLKNRELREKMGKVGRKYVTTNFDVKSQVEKTTALYLRLLKEHSLAQKVATIAGRNPASQG